MDEGVVRRTYRTSVFVWAFVTLALVAFSKWFAAIGFTVGAAVSLGLLASLEFVVNRAFTPGTEDSGKALVKLGVAKLLLVAAIITAVVLTRRLDLIVAFCCGAALSQVIITLKALGGMLIQRIGK